MRETTRLERSRSVSLVVIHIRRATISELPKWAGNDRTEDVVSGSEMFAA